MKESGYYPPGAEFDPNAPYNQKENDEVDVDVCVSVTLSKSTTISTTDYVATEYEDSEPDDEGNICNIRGVDYDFSNTDLKSAYEEQEFTLPEILDECIKLFKRDIEHNTQIINILTALNPNFSEETQEETGQEVKKLEAENKHWNRILEALKGWTVDELEVVEE